MVPKPAPQLIVQNRYLRELSFLWGIGLIALFFILCTVMERLSETLPPLLCILFLLF